MPQIFQNIQLFEKMNADAIRLIRFIRRQFKDADAFSFIINVGNDVFWHFSWQIGKLALILQFKEEISYFEEEMHQQDVWKQTVTTPTSVCLDRSSILIELCAPLKDMIRT